MKKENGDTSKCQVRNVARRSVIGKTEPKTRVWKRLLGLQTLVVKGLVFERQGLSSTLSLSSRTTTLGYSEERLTC